MPLLQLLNAIRKDDILVVFVGKKLVLLSESIWRMLVTFPGIRDPGCVYSPVVVYNGQFTARPRHSGGESVFRFPFLIASALLLR